MNEAPLVLLRVATRPFETLTGLGAGPSLALVEELLDLEARLASRAAALEEALFRAAGARERVADPEHARGRLAVLAIRRDVHNSRAARAEALEAARPWLRAPLAREIEIHGEALERCEELEHRCRAAVADELVARRAALLEAASDPLIQEAIWLASRSLLASIRGLCGSDPGAWGRGERHLAAKALAYLARACTKTSPNSLFCATALVEVGSGPLAIRGRPEIARVDVLLNVAEARKVAACLAQDPAIDRAVFPRVNPTLREEDGAWTFWKPASMRNPDEEEVRSRVRHNDVVRVFLEEAEHGERNVPALIEAVAKRCEVEPQEAQAFYRQLVDRGILIGEVEIPYNARRPLRFLAAAVREHGCDPPWLGTIESVETRMDALPSLGPLERIEAMERAGRPLEGLPHTRPLHPDELYRLDAQSSLSVRMPASMIDEVRAGIAPYVRLFTAMYPERIYGSSAAARFLRSFPADTDVDLLDLYHGVFEPLDQKRPVAFPDPGRVAADSDGTLEAAAALGRARDHFAALARTAEDGREIEITDQELSRIVGDVPEPRWSCGVLFHIAAGNVADIAGGRYRLVLSALFQGTGLALARFAHLLGPDRVIRELQRCWSCLERPGALVAELTYNHNFRTANAGLRPAIFRHEIELPGEKASPGTEVFRLADLVVRWDSRARRFLLRHRRTGVEVIPVINSGVNPVGVISFLVHVGQQGFQPLGYFPGFDVPGISHWPRVVCGRMVLFRERWTFSPDAAPAALRQGRILDETDFFLEVARWRRRHRIPRHVFVHTSADPKPRYFDLESPPFVDLLQRSLARSGKEPPPGLEVLEMLPDPESLWIEDGRGRYPSEFLVHLQGGSP